MKKYYTKVCNFYYGKNSIKLINQKKNLPLNGNKEISFNQIEIISKSETKLINLKDIKKLPKLLKEKINKDLKIIVKKNKNFSSCLLYTSPSPRDAHESRMPSSA